MEYTAELPAEASELQPAIFGSAVPAPGVKFHLGFRVKIESESGIEEPATKSASYPYQSDHATFILNMYFYREKFTPTHRS